MKIFKVLIGVILLGVLLSISSNAFSKEVFAGWDWEKGLPSFENENWQSLYLSPPEAKEGVIPVSLDYVVKVEDIPLFIYYRFAYLNEKKEKINVLLVSYCKTVEELKREGIKDEEIIKLNQFNIFLPRFALTVFLKEGYAKVIGYQFKENSLEPEKIEKWRTEIKPDKILLSKKTDFYSSFTNWIKSICEKRGLEVEMSGIRKLLPIFKAKDRQIYLFVSSN